MISLINTHESQREYVKAMERGYGYTCHGNVAHYLFRVDQVEPSILAQLPHAEAYIFSYEGCTMASYRPGISVAVITPYPASESIVNWTRYVDRIKVERGALTAEEPSKPYKTCHASARHERKDGNVGRCGKQVRHDHTAPCPLCGADNSYQWL